MMIRGSLLFESRVILDGSQTGDKFVAFYALFESRVILDGSQTLKFPICGI
mgnify:CR=1 FL=1